MKLLLLFAVVGVLAACSNGSRFPRTSAKPPTTRVEPVKDVLHGVDIVDNYRWLEGDNSDAKDQGKVTPEVAKWTDDENSYTRAVLDNLPGRAVLETTLRPLMEIGAVTAPTMRGSRYFFSKREGSQNQAVIYWRDGYKGANHVLIDPATLDASGLTTVEWVSPSHDGKTLAYGTYRAGDENTTLHVMNVDTGAVLPFEIPDKTQAPEWLPDGSGFVYQNLKNPKDPYSGQVLFHRMGTERVKDALLFRQFTAAENAKLATTWGPFGSLSEDGRWLLLGYWIDTKSNDMWLVDFSAFLKTGKVEKKVVTVGVDGQASGTVIDGTLYLQTTKGAPKGRVVATSAATPESSKWKDLVPERDDAVIENVSFGRGVIAVTYLKNASNVVEVFDLTGRSLGVVNQPGIGAAGIATEQDRTEAYLTFTSFNYPTTIFRVDLAKPSAAGELWERPDVPVDPSTVEVEQVWYPSKDGTKVSMFVVHRKGIALDGARPTHLYAYGGFDISLTPTFDPSEFVFLERGGVFAVANLRGGGEYGEAWHQAGMLEKKQNVFDDFIAAAEWLIANKYTSTKHLAIEGGSNGGLLTGAVLVQRPDLFGAVLCRVPVADMLRYHRFTVGRYWIPEYGSADDPAQFPFLFRYSPLHNVKDGVAYPPTLVMTADTDDRVAPGMAKKFAARLQAATGGMSPILIRIESKAGHGAGKPVEKILDEDADIYTFLLQMLR